MAWFFHVFFGNFSDLIAYLTPVESASWDNAIDRTKYFSCHFKLLKSKFGQEEKYLGFKDQSGRRLGPYGT